MRRRRRSNWPLNLLCAGMVVLFCVYILGIPLATSWMASLGSESTSVLRVAAPPLSQQILFRAFEFLVAAWFFMFGACIGSFLNVVIYRTPRGLSLLGSSRCPYCRSAIRFYDNIPVFAWISLRGRCRDCRLPISPRYPLVEFTTGAIFLGLAVLELFLEGQNLPTDYGGLRLSVSWLVNHFPWDLVAVYLYHATLLSILLSWALIAFDGHKLPKLYIVLAVAIGVAGPAVNPSVQPIPWSSTTPTWLAARPWTTRLDTSIVGWACGLGVGLTLSSVWILNKRSRRRSPACVRDAMAVFGVVGLFLGWQALISVAAMAACTRLVAAVAAIAMSRRNGIGSTGAEDPSGRGKKTARRPRMMFTHVLLATALQIVLWASLSHLTWWPGPKCSTLAVSAVVIVTVLLALAADGIQYACASSLSSCDIPE